jgi:hypothetical protein
MPTSNIPLTYACRLNGVVHLYIVIYASQRPGYPQQGARTDETMNFFINNVQTAGTDPHFEYYSFNINGFDTQGKPYKITDIEVHYSTHIRKILVDDLDLVDALPTSTSDQAFDVPYAYTQLGTDDHHFGAEIVLYSETAKKFKCVHTSPEEVDEDGNTESNITIDALAPAVTIFSASNLFEVDDVLTTEGEHAVIFTEGNNPPKRRRSKTKNKNISIAPFPGDK